MTDITELWYTRCPVPTPVGLAAQLGFLDADFAAAGVRLRPILDAPDRSVRESHFSHSLPWSFRHGGNVPPIRARSEGRDTRLVGITWTDEFQALVTRAESGIESVADLRGRRFGLPRRPEGIVDFHRATALKGLAAGLSLGGLTPTDVEIVDLVAAEDVLVAPGDPSLFGLKRRLPYATEVAALLRGEADAIYLKGAQGVTVANLFGLREVASFGFHADPAVRINSGTPRVLTVDARLADERPDLVARLIGAIRRAGAWAEAHPDEARRFVAVETDVSEEAVAAANGPDLHRRLGLSLDPDEVRAVASYKDFLRDHGFLAADFDVGEWIDARPWGLVSGLARGDAA
jgi:ABC-type nitrate/sulfonate/bicarbonate transport system substrate-binding protein